MSHIYELTMDFKPFDEKFKWQDRTPDTNEVNYQVYGPGDLTGILSPECLQWCEEVGIHPAYAAVFQKPPITNEHVYYNIHIDGILDGGMSSRTFALNWNFEGDGTLMTWFDPLTPGTVTIGGTLPPHIGFQPDEVVAIQSATSAGPLLFDTVTPHSVTNTSKTTWARSVTIGFRERLAWADVPTYFAKWIK